MRGNFITDRKGDKNPRYKDGRKGTRLYSIYRNMLNRCYNPITYAYKYYGGRGIKVCSDWLTDFIYFKNWALNNGYHDNLTLDRIDVEGEYAPYNCRWVAMDVQCNNRRNNHYITYHNETLTVKQWCDELGLNYNTVRSRLQSGWNEIDAITRPTDIRFRSKERR